MFFITDKKMIRYNDVYYSGLNPSLDMFSGGTSSVCLFLEKFTALKTNVNPTNYSNLTSLAQQAGEWSYSEEYNSLRIHSSSLAQRERVRVRGLSQGGQPWSP